MTAEEEVFRRQGFGCRLEVTGRLALVMVDFVNGFADPAVLGGGNVSQAVMAAGELLSVARSQRLPIAHSRIVFSEDGSDRNVFAEKVPALSRLTENEPDSQLIGSLAALDGELVVRKTVPSAFFGTTLAAWLTARQVAAVLVAGTTTSGCIRATVVDAMSLGFKPVIVRDAVGDRSLAAHEASLFDIQQKYGEVVSLAEGLALIMMSSTCRGDSLDPAAQTPGG